MKTYVAGSRIGRDTVSQMRSLHEPERSEDRYYGPFDRQSANGQGSA